MSYIGTPPSNAFTSLLKQDFSTSATTGYTLDHAVNNANDIALFINFVRQEPTAGYAASGTSLVLTSATASSDDMYCVYLGQALQTVNPANASVGAAQLASNAVTTAKILDANVTAAKLGTDAKNTPAFSAYANTDQNSLTDDTYTKLAMNAEFYDTDSKYDVSNYRFTPTVAGKYNFGACVFIEGSANFITVNLALYKNGSQLFYVSENVDSLSGNTINATIELDSDDYVELYAKADVESGGTWSLNKDGDEANNRCFWFGYKLIT